MLWGADSTLETIADFCKNLENFEVKITAHTDSIGTLQNNLQLSQRRANEVKKFLIGKGVPAQMIAAAFFGKAQPIADNDTEEGRRLNRRATIEVLKKAEMLSLEGIVTDAKTGKPVNAIVIVHTKESRDTIQANELGQFKKAFPSGTVVGVDAYAACYFMASEMVKVSKGMKQVKLSLKPTLLGEKADIGNFFFLGGLDVLVEKSKPELPKILQFMQLNSMLKIEIAGHVNFPNRPPVGQYSSEYILSVNRAKTVYDYLLSHGIAKDRISYKGYGNSEMRFPKAKTEPEMAQNRRVEIRVLESDCQTDGS